LLIDDIESSLKLISARQSDGITSFTDYGGRYSIQLSYGGYGRILVQIQVNPVLESGTDVVVTLTPSSGITESITLEA